VANEDTVSVQLAIAVVLAWAWVSAMAARLLTGLPGVRASINRRSGSD